jgi:transposase
VVVPGAAAADTILPRLGRSLADARDQRRQIAAQVEQDLDAHPLAEVLASMRGVGVRTAARILLEVGDASSFPTAAHLAAHTGLAPLAHRSGTSIRGEHPARSGNKHLKRALFLERVRRPPRRPDQPRLLGPQECRGKKHNAALVCLARRRCDVLHAMLWTQTTSQPRLPDGA